MCRLQNPVAAADAVSRTDSCSTQWTKYVLNTTDTDMATIQLQIWPWLPHYNHIILTLTVCKYNKIIKDIIIQNTIIVIMFASWASVAEWLRQGCPLGHAAQVRLWYRPIRGTASIRQSILPTPIQWFTKHPIVQVRMSTDVKRWSWGVNDKHVQSQLQLHQLRKMTGFTCSDNDRPYKTTVLNNSSRKYFHRFLFWLTVWFV